MLYNKQHCSVTQRYTQVKFVRVTCTEPVVRHVQMKDLGAPDSGYFVLVRCTPIFKRNLIFATYCVIMLKQKLHVSSLFVQGACYC